MRREQLKQMQGSAVIGEFNESAFFADTKLSALDEAYDIAISQMRAGTVKSTAVTWERHYKHVRC